MKKLRKITGAILSFVFLLSCIGGAAYAAESPKTVSPTNSAVFINGTSVSFQAYTVDGYNYFKLRDIAKALTGTGKQFDVGYDGANNAITLTPGKAYTPVGGELSAGVPGNQPAAASTSKIYLNGNQISLTAYQIGGYNYFKLRDIGAAINFGVTYHPGTNAIDVDTSAAYSAETSNAGFFDPTVDYTKHPRYKIVYLMISSGTLYDAMSKSYNNWADRMNCDYTDWTANADLDLYIETLQTYAIQGIDGFLLDADLSLYPRIEEITKELNIPWMSGMAAPQDDSGALIHPTVVFDNARMGVQMASWVIDYAKKTWPNAAASEIGMLSMDFSIVPVIHARTTGAQSVWKQYYPEQSAHFFIADGVVGTLDSDTGYNLAEAIFAMNPNIKYWLICAFFDDYASGAAKAAAASGMSDRCVIIDVGGAALVNNWDNGENSSWKASVFASQALYAEPIVGGLYALMEGTATPETLWPDWVNKNAGDKYATIQTPVAVITQDNYQEYLEWVDSYTGFNESNYPYHGTQFTLRATPPASYHG
ncbi:ABC-type sugar transport system, substrate-binding protein, contains N-terminal xre family HTH domain [Sporobacter termitidis DSM 10068]|uniref:ABC-type sugar transport system, substrate-binding protein, contains N-terminal xre family HTH domain n=1 Tax=Sporobacter termitidis DSM 10068 TaxID=1123282 RepID=A0A1M5YUX5_9FIRM|nr:hypothetical protein [Sporobacter termitidis]SHI15821.1 ABC-type sugar transport system, substrate-binding protein, contains N-terminal xre family HTH domain [Sporobacter termitidis DSM 10068]